jgi:hypothetical protein
MGLIDLDSFSSVPFIQKAMPRLLEYAPAALLFLNMHPDGWLDRWLTKLSNKHFTQGLPDFPSVQEELKSHIDSKPIRKIDATAAPRAYIDSIRDASKPPAQQISTQYVGEVEQATLHLKQSVKDSDSGFRGAIYQDDNGHAIVFFSGMDIHSGGSLRDFEAIVQAKMMKQSVNHHIPPAQELYLQAVRESTSVEIVAYSLGAMLANDMAARLGAKATTFADIGLPDRNHMYTEEQIQRIKDNVLSLRLESDQFTAKAGPVHGTIVDLPAVTGGEVLSTLSSKGNFNEHSKLVVHDPKAYMLASEKIIPAVYLGAIPTLPRAPFVKNIWDAIGDTAWVPAANEDNLEYIAS